MADREDVQKLKSLRVDSAVRRLFAQRQGWPTQPR
jgi:hypothetical protein